MRPALLLAALPALVLSACAPRQTVLQVPEFVIEDVRLTAFNVAIPASATLTLRLRVYNPNPYPLRLARADGRFVLDGRDVGALALPNVDLPARAETSQNARLDLPVSLENLGLFLRVARGEAVSYRVDGTFTVDAGLLGRPTFGPYTLSQGVLRQPRLLP